MTRIQNQSKLVEVGQTKYVRKVLLVINQKCSQFDSKGECNAMVEVASGYPLDFCARHLHMQKDGIPLKCWRCGDDPVTLGSRDAYIRKGFA